MVLQLLRIWSCTPRSMVLHVAFIKIQCYCSQHSRAEFPQGFWLWLNISTTGFCFKTPFVSAGMDIRGYSCLQSSGTASICRPLAGRKGGLGVRWGPRRYLTSTPPFFWWLRYACFLWFPATSCHFLGWEWPELSVASIPMIVYYIIWNRWIKIHLPAIYWCKHDAARAFEGFWSIAICWIAKSSIKGYSFTMTLEGKLFFLYAASILPLFPCQVGNFPSPLRRPGNGHSTLPLCWLTVSHWFRDTFASFIAQVWLGSTLTAMISQWYYMGATLV